MTRFRTSAEDVGHPPEQTSGWTQPGLLEFAAAAGSLPGVTDVELPNGAHQAPPILTPEDPRLDKTIGALLTDPRQPNIQANVRTRIDNMLRRRHVNSVKDLLAHGYDDLTDIPNIGGRAVDLLRNALEVQGFDWKEKPEVADWAQLYRDFRDIPLTVLRNKLTTHELDTLLAAHPNDGGPISRAEQLLAMDESKILILFGKAATGLYRGRPPQDILPAMRDLLFAFVQAQARMRVRG